MFARRKTFILLLLVFVSSVSLIIANFYTIRITSSVRAYIKGESEFSKSQKDAFLYLLNYIQTGDEHFYRSFTEEIAVPKGDNLAGVALLNNGPVNKVKEGFLMGRNNPEDFDKMIWLYKDFNGVSFIQIAIKVWEEAEPLIDEADSIAASAKLHIQEGTFTTAEKLAFSNRINVITGELSKKERIFSTVLDDTARNTDKYLFWLNVICIVLILGNLVGYAVIMINRLSASAKEQQKYNLELVNVNKELDTFVYSASHDLRSPIASLKGLVDLSLTEDEQSTRIHYLRLMNGIIEKLDIFIKEILDFFKNKRTAVDNETVSLEKLTGEAVALVEFITGAHTIDIVKNLEVDTIQSDELRLKIILNNLISNAVKYSDSNKKNKFIRITSRYDGACCIIAVEDNGVGIKEEYFESIFNMFFVTPKSKKGTGLGLYIVKETVEKLGGKITVTSKVNTGSTFTVSLPLQTAGNNEVQHRKGNYAKASSK